MAHELWGKFYEPFGPRKTSMNHSVRLKWLTDSLVCQSVFWLDQFWQSCLHWRLPLLRCFPPHHRSIRYCSWTHGVSSNVLTTLNTKCNVWQSYQSQRSRVSIWVPHSTKVGPAAISSSNNEENTNTNMPMNCYKIHIYKYIYISYRFLWILTIFQELFHPIPLTRGIPSEPGSDLGSPWTSVCRGNILSKFIPCSKASKSARWAGCSVQPVASEATQSDWRIHWWESMHQGWKNPSVWQVVPSMKHIHSRLYKYCVTLTIWVLIGQRTVLRTAGFVGLSMGCRTGGVKVFNM